MAVDIKQGDSYAKDYYSDDYPTLDANWEGEWAIKALLEDEVPIASGTLAVSTDNTVLELRITPADTEDIPAGSYKLIVQLRNDDISFQKEIHDSFKIKPQGIPTP